MPRHRAQPFNYKSKTGEMIASEIDLLPPPGKTVKSNQNDDFGYHYDSQTRIIFSIGSNNLNLLINTTNPTNQFGKRHS